MMYSTYKLNKQGDNIQPCLTPFAIFNQSTQLKIIILYMPKWVSHNQRHWQGYLPDSEGLGVDMFFTFSTFWSHPHFSAMFFHPQSSSSVWIFFHHSLLCLSSIFKGPLPFVCVLVGQSRLTLCSPMVCSQPSSSVHGKFSRQDYWRG